MVSMPTGEEPPVGFEGLVEERKYRAEHAGLTVNCVLSSQLAELEITELKNFHEKDDTIAYAGSRQRVRRRIPFEFGLRLHPVGRSSTDMLVVRAFENGMLVGYAFIAYAWPKPTSWVIDFMLVDATDSPDVIASAMLDKIKGYIEHAGSDAASLTVVNGNEATDGFWVGSDFIDCTDELSLIVERAVRRAYRLNMSK
jgi:hypothetical protein